MRRLIGWCAVLAALGACGHADDTTATNAADADADAAANVHIDEFVSVLTRDGSWGPFALPAYLTDVSDLLPDVAFEVEGSDSAASMEESIFSTHRQLVVVATVEDVAPLRGRYWRPDGDISVPEYVEADDPRAEELFVGFRLKVNEHLQGQQRAEVLAGALIDADDLDRLQRLSPDLPPMVWFLGTPEHTVLDPVADHENLFQPAFPWFGVVEDDQALSFPLLRDDAAFTERTGTLDSLRAEARAGERTVTVEFDPRRDDYVQTDDGR